MVRTCTTAHAGPALASKAPSFVESSYSFWSKEDPQGHDEVASSVGATVGVIASEHSALPRSASPLSPVLERVASMQFRGLRNGSSVAGIKSSNAVEEGRIARLVPVPESDVVKRPGRAVDLQVEVDGGVRIAGGPSDEPWGDDSLEESRPSTLPPPYQRY